jgi:threonine/homoserine/homoserine lactone efflux protein
MFKFIALIALVGAAVLFYLGYQRSQSVAGAAAQTVANVHQSIDGKAGLTQQQEYYIGGAVLAVLGVIGLAVRR